MHTSLQQGTYLVEQRMDEFHILTYYATFHIISDLSKLLGLMSKLFGNAIQLSSWHLVCIVLKHDSSSGVEKFLLLVCHLFNKHNHWK